MKSSCDNRKKILSLIKEHPRFKELKDECKRTGGKNSVVFFKQPTEDEKIPKSIVQKFLSWLNLEHNEVIDPYLMMKREREKDRLSLDVISIPEQVRKTHREIFPFFLLYTVREALKHDLSHIVLTISPEEIVLIQGGYGRYETREAAINDGVSFSAQTEQQLASIKKQEAVLRRMCNKYGFHEFFPSDQEIRPKGIHMELNVSDIRKDTIEQLLSQLDSLMTTRKTH